MLWWTWEIDCRFSLITMALIHSYFVDIFVHDKLFYSSASLHWLNCEYVFNKTFFFIYTCICVNHFNHVYSKWKETFLSLWKSRLSKLFSSYLYILAQATFLQRAEILTQNTIENIKLLIVNALVMPIFLRLFTRYVLCHGEYILI